MDVPPEYVGARGDCFFGDCDCRFFIGGSGVCTSCRHPNTFHSLRPTREAEAQRRDDDIRRARIFTKRQIRLQREADAQATRTAAERAANAKSPRLTAPPCTVRACECARFEVQQVAVSVLTPTAAAAAAVTTVDSAAVLSDMTAPRLCRKCRHAELYHIKSAVNADGNSGAQANVKAKGKSASSAATISKK